MPKSATRIALNAAEAAAAVGLSEDVIKKAIRSGKLRAKRSGVNANGDGTGRYLIRVDDLDAWLEGLTDA